MKVFAEDFVKIYDPTIGENEPWYINDHTIVYANGEWHLFGITHAEPGSPLEEVLCAHAVTKDILHTPLTKCPYPFSADPEYKEKHFWAPHIILHEGLYYMFYCGGSLEGSDTYRIHLATSSDLINWKRHPENPMVIDGFDARDPMILRVGEKWVMYYTCTSTPQGGNHCVAALTSDDLVHWGNKQIVFRSEIQGTIAGPCESPFVEKVGNTYFLFIGPYGGYDVSYCDTAVYASTDPYSFGGEPVGRIKAHACEIIKIEDRHYITHCGWGQGGVYISPMHFEF